MAISKRGRKVKKRYRVTAEAPLGVPRAAICRGCSTGYVVPAEIVDVDRSYRYLDERFAEHAKKKHGDSSQAIERIVSEATNG
jgi:hypothetical protein